MPLLDSRWLLHREFSFDNDFPCSGGDTVRVLDAQLYFVAVDLNYVHDDVITDDDGLVLAPRDDKHGNVPRFSMK
jgi:hypothetical protein